MDYVSSLSGNTTPVVRKYQIGEAMANAGVPVVIGGANNEGIALAATTTASDLVGVTQDAQATLVTAQQTDNSDPARLVTVCVDPQAVYRARLSGGATAGTALTVRSVTTASTTGLVVTTGDDWSSPSVDECMLWGYSGANVKIARKITSVSTLAATLLVALPQDTAVGDEFLWAPFCASPAGMENQFVQLTSDLTEVDGSVAVDTDNNNFRVFEVDFRDASEEGNLKSFALLVPFDSIFAAGGSI